MYTKEEITLALDDKRKYEQPIFLRQKSVEPVWERYPKGTMYHNLPDDEPDNDYIKFVEEITNTKYYIKDWGDNC